MTSDDFNYIENVLEMIGAPKPSRCIECEARIKDVLDRLCEECWEERIKNVES